MGAYLERDRSLTLQSQSCKDEKLPLIFSRAESFDKKGHLRESFSLCVSLEPSWITS